MIWMSKSEVDIPYSNVNHIKDGIVDLAAGTVGKIFQCFFLTFTYLSEINCCCFFELIFHLMKIFFSNSFIIRYNR